MAVQVKRGVDFPMVDLANIAYYPRIFDLAHRFFEDAWTHICDVRYADLLLIGKLGSPSSTLSPISMHHYATGIRLLQRFGLTQSESHPVHGAMNFIIRIENYSGPLLR